MHPEIMKLTGEKIGISNFGMYDGGEELKLKMFIVGVLELENRDWFWSDVGVVLFGELSEAIKGRE